MVTDFENVNRPSPPEFVLLKTEMAFSTDHPRKSYDLVYPAAIALPSFTVVTAITPAAAAAAIATDVELSFPSILTSA